MLTNTIYKQFKKRNRNLFQNKFRNYESIFKTTDSRTFSIKITFC